jgi:twitching motility protein PilT
MLDRVNRERAQHIITIEDPIEYQHHHKKSIVVQREVHFDTPSFSSALRSALREDPDVVLIGEMRDLETISTAITVAETGHLVFATLHTNSAAQSIDRMIDLPSADVERVSEEVINLLGCSKEDIIPVSAKTGLNVESILDAVIARIPEPKKLDNNSNFVPVIARNEAIQAPGTLDRHAPLAMTETNATVK